MESCPDLTHCRGQHLASSLCFQSSSLKVFLNLYEIKVITQPRNLLYFRSQRPKRANNSILFYSYVKESLPNAPGPILGREI